MNKIFFILSIVLFASCETKPYLKHSVSLEKIANDCSAGEDMNMNSNTNGDRYEITKCLSASYDKSKISILRQGDTVVIHFNDNPGNTNMFKVTIDIDTYPKYNFLDVEGNVFPVVGAN